MVALDELGSREFSLAPDVALLFLDSDSWSRRDPARPSDAARLVRHLLEELGRERRGGMLYRAGQGLNAILTSTVAVPSVGAAVQSLARRREARHCHQLLRARPIGGAEKVGQAFVSAIAPLLYSDRAGVTSADSRKWVLNGTDRSDLDWDVKQAPGGILDLEDLVHGLVLEHGSEKPTVRTGNVADALFALGRSGALEEQAASTLIDCLGWLRRAEHALQLTSEESTWNFPRDTEGQCALARCMGYREPDASRARSRLLQDWQAVREEVGMRRDELRPFASGNRTGR
jgi:glutamate-ammonia-ligase adenylyltransferase